AAAVLLSGLLVAFVAPGTASAAEPDALKTISAGDDHNCFLGTGGTVWCVGDNDAGQTGTFTNKADVTTPAQVPGISGAVSVTSGENHSCALMGDGSAKCWGKGNRGQLGNGQSGDIYTSPTPVTVSGVSDFIYVNAGDRHSCGVRSNRTIVCWGDNLYGQLGNGALGLSTTPSTVSGITNAESVSGGQTHTCAVLTDGQARCWGRNNRGQLGDGANPFVDRLTPVPVTNLSNVDSIAAGWNHTCAVANGNVHCWGHNESGQIGGGVNESEIRNRPKKVSGLSNVVQVAVGFRYSCAVTSAGKASCWGDNTGGQIGNNEHGNNSGQGGSDLNQPTPYELPINGVAAVATGDQHTCVTATAGLYCWGDNNDGQLAQGNFVDVFTPIGVAIAGGTPPVAPPPPPEFESVDEMVADPSFTTADADTLRLYNAFFNRDPDLLGAIYWVDLKRGGVTLSRIALEFSRSAEFTNTYGALDNAAYVEQIYINVLGRQYDQAGYDYWLGLLNDGSLDRGGVVRWISGDVEFKNNNLYGGK
ncbi:MAG: DUF4214 domain-containing protein, partial [Acidimicrobiales bacterium]